MEIKLDIELVWGLQSPSATLLCSVFCSLQMQLLPAPWLNLSTFSFFHMYRILCPSILIFDNMLLTADDDFM